MKSVFRVGTMIAVNKGYKLFPLIMDAGSKPILKRHLILNFIIITYRVSDTFQNDNINNLFVSILSYNKKWYSKKLNKYFCLIFF